MTKSTTIPTPVISTELLSEMDEYSPFFRTMSDLRSESNITLSLLIIDEKTKLLKNEWWVKFHTVLITLQNDIDKIWRHSEFILSSVQRFDFKEEKANGFRSFIEIVFRCSTIILVKLRIIDAENVPGRWNKTVVNDIIAFSDCLQELSQCLYFLSEMKRLSTNDSLIPSLTVNKSVEIQQIIEGSYTLRQDVFFNQCLGFYYCPSAQRILQVLGSIMSGYAHSFMTNKSGFRGAFNTLYKSVASFWNPDDRGKLMTMITRNATIDFTKQFWNLGEHPLVLEAPNIILPPVDVAVNFDLPPVPFTVPSKFTDSSQVTIYPPADGINQYSTRPIKLRLISLRMREGLSWIYQSNSTGISPDKSFINSFQKKSPICKERSKYLLLHCHGGGFVAQSAKSHDIYIRSWSEQLDCPILSIDYSLAPEYPYPRALEECFYAISWAMRNRRQLGCTDDARVVLCGDSAGANLALCATLKAIKLGVSVPDALFLAYIPVLIAVTPSPARLMSSIDPLLPVGILIRCLLAYVGVDEKAFMSTYSQNSPMNVNACKENDKCTKASNTKDNESQTLLTGPYSLDDKTSPLTVIRLAQIPEDPFLSPLLIDEDTLSQLPQTAIISSHFDPLLDDCIELCKRLDKVGVSVAFKVMSDIPHGFLNFVLLSRECELASQECVRMIGMLFDKSVTLKG